MDLLKDHTGQNVADSLMEILANWEINANIVVAATTDNGSNLLLNLFMCEKGFG